MTSSFQGRDARQRSRFDFPSRVSQIRPLSRVLNSLSRAPLDIATWLPPVPLMQSTPSQTHHRLPLLLLFHHFPPLSSWLLQTSNPTCVLSTLLRTWHLVGAQQKCALCMNKIISIFQSLKFDCSPLTSLLPATLLNGTWNWLGSTPAQVLELLPSTVPVASALTVSQSPLGFSPPVVLE